MVKVILPVVAVLACWVCAPAQADVLPVQAPSVTVPQAAGDAVGTVTATVAKATDESVRATPAPTRQTLQGAAAAAQPAATVVSTTVQVAQGRAGDSGGLRVGASSVRRVPSARLRRSVPPREPAAPVRSESRPDTRPAPLAQHAQAPAADHAPAARPERQSPPNPVPAPHADGGISAGSSALFAGGFAMLAGALMLVAPRMRRRLLIQWAALRPVAFVALLERPG